MYKLGLNSGEKVTFRVTPGQKKQLIRMAGISNKTLSDYARDAALSPNVDTAKMDFYQSINTDLLHLKKSQLVMTQLMLLIGSNQLESQDKIMEFYHESIGDAEEKFGEE